MGNLISSHTERRVAPPRQSGGAVAGFRTTDVPETVEENFFEEEELVPGFRTLLQSRRYIRTKTTSDYDEFFMNLSEPLTKFIERVLNEHRTARFAVLVYPHYEKIDAYTDNGEPLIIHPVLRTALLTVLRRQSIPQAVHSIIESLRSRHVNFIRDGSGLCLREIRQADFLAGRVNYLAYFGRAFVRLPDFLKRKMAIINVENSDERCFGFAILSALHPVERHANRVGCYTRFFDDHPALRDLQYPVGLDHFEEIEERIQVPFNVFTFYDDKGEARYPLYLSRVDANRAVDLLFWDGHFAWIKNFARFMADRNTNGHVRFFCRRCLGRFTSEIVLQSHQQHCISIDGCQQIYTMPKEGTKLTFRNELHQQRFPFVVIADFESLTVPWTAATSKQDPAHCYQKHKPISVGMIMVSSVAGDLGMMPYETYTNDDVAEWFLNRLLVYRNLVFEYLFDTKRLIMTGDDHHDFDSAVVCYVCRKPFPTDLTNVRRGLRKVRDHDHLTGKYRGAAHSNCNLKLRQKYVLPVFLHNFRGYDSHLIVPAFTKFKGVDLRVIGQGLEKYLSLTFDKNIVFKDSLQLLSGSLDSLAQCLLKAGKDKFRLLRREFEDVTDDVGIDLLLRKGVYPYDYMTDAQRFAETELPSRQHFFSRLHNSECSEADYAHAQNVWQKFNCGTFIDYHNLYLKTDVLLLADVFESFRDTTMKELGLDPAYYLSAPQLSWDCMMKMTGCELALLSDPEMFRLLNENLRGGISVISKRHSKANNKYMGDMYDSEQPSSYIFYIDANNLYGHAMSEPMPYDDFSWLSEDDCANINWLTQHDDQDYGYFVECDLHYPDDLHDKHNDYPLAPERIVVEEHLLSELQCDIREQYAISHASTPKLVPNFFDKTKMLLHYRNLRFYLEQGLQLTKVHRAIRFRQSRWLQPYIQVNTELRAKSTDPVQVKFRKDMNNTVYGKTCENLTKRTDVRLVTSEQKCQKLIQKPHCLRFQVFAPDVAGVELRKVKCMINKPAYVGFTVLELSKLHMFKFHYEHFKLWYPNAELLFTDTDSLVYEVHTDDLYEELAGYSGYFDFSAYPQSHPRFSEENKMVLGKMKDEASAKIITEFVGLRPKMYSYLKLDGSAQTETKRAKGIQRAAMTNVRHEHYLAQLNQAAENYVNIRRIGQKHHRVYTIEAAKRGLCAFDDKRYMLPDGIHTLAHGHYRLRNDDLAQSTCSIDDYLSSVRPVTLVDPEEVTNFHVVSYNDAVKQNLLPCQTRADALAATSGIDLRRAIDENVARKRYCSEPADSSEAPIPTKHMRFAEDELENDDVDADEDLREVVEVARSTAVFDFE